MVMNLFDNKKVLSIKPAILFIILIAWSLEGFSMSLLNKPEEEVVVFSPMEGKITFNNIPVEGAKVERFLKWKDDTGEKDTTTTDADGNFSFPIKTDKVILSKISTFVMSQEIRVYYKDNEYPVWAKAKWDKGLYGELDGIPANFRCELTDDLTRVEAGEGMTYTLCKWDSIKPMD